MKLQKAGLGEKEVSVPGNVSSTEVHRALLDAFPPLQSTGYELLQASGSSIKDLESVGDLTGAAILRVTLGQAKCYIRPLLAKLSLEPIPESSDTVHKNSC